MAAIIGNMEASYQAIWTICNFNVEFNNRHVIESPVFFFEGIRINMRLYKEFFRPDFYSLFFIGYTEKTMKVTFGIMKENEMACMNEFESSLNYAKGFVEFMHADDVASFLAVRHVTIVAYFKLSQIEDYEERIDGTFSVSIFDKLSDDLTKLYKSCKNADLIIELEGSQKKFHVHRAILCARSKVFKANLQSDMLEARRSCIKVKWDEHIFHTFLLFVYSGVLNNCNLNEVYNLYKITDYYDVLDLKTACQVMLSQNVTLDNFFNLLILSHEHNDSEIMASIKLFFGIKRQEIIESEEWKELHENNPDILNLHFREEI